MPKNEGIIQHGGSLTAHNLAVGQNAVALGSSAPDLSDLRRRVDELLSEIRRHASELPQSTEVVSTAETLAQEVAKPAPSRVTIKGLLSGIAEAGKVVASIGGAVTAIQKLLP